MDTEKQKYYIINELGHDIVEGKEYQYKYPKTIIFKRINGFLGYNYIEPNNERLLFRTDNMWRRFSISSETKTCTIPN